MFMTIYPLKNAIVPGVFIGMAPFLEQKHSPAQPDHASKASAEGVGSASCTNTDGPCDPLERLTECLCSWVTM